MAVFSYRATTREGVIVEGLLDAADEDLAAEKLKKTGIIPLKLLSADRGAKKRIINLRSNKADLQTFTGELSVLLNAGLPLDRSLNILSEVFEKKEMKDIIQSILQSIREGKSFSDAIQNQPQIFPRLYINMIKAGEASGLLDIVLSKLNEYLGSSKELKDHIFSAMIYPAILFVTGIVSIIILITFVIPKFSVIFGDLGRSLPLPTKILLAVSSTLQSYWWILLMSVIAGFFMFRYYIKSGSGRYYWDVLKLKLLGDIIIKLETARFCRTLGTLLKSGVPLLQALNNAKDVIENQVISSSLDTISKGVKEGKGMSGPLSGVKTFPTLALSMVKVGEETGQLDDMLLNVASAYEKDLKETVKRFISLLEPMMILGMGLVIGFIVVSILMAIFSIIDLPF
jgi:general secretion pathway protein F